MNCNLVRSCSIKHVSQLYKAGYRNYCSWKTIVGIEAHVQLASREKLFSPSQNEFDAPLNSHVAPWDLALPGSLPILNQEAVELAVRAAHLLNCQIRRVSTFDRKHYNYADLPSGYQITQYYNPFAMGGFVRIRNREGDCDSTMGHREIGIRQIHLEHDSARTINDGENSIYDLNRCGMALVEIVTEPVLYSAGEAVAFARELHGILVDGSITKGILAHGNVRFDVNVSVTGPQAPPDVPPLGDRVEIKNLNSFESIKEAIIFEARRHIEILEAGGRVKRETRSFDEKLGVTHGSRQKEETESIKSAGSYRYLPEPDLPSLILENDYIQRVISSIPESGRRKAARLQQCYNLTQESVDALLSCHENMSAISLLDLFEILATKVSDTRLLLNFILNEFVGIFNNYLFQQRLRQGKELSLESIVVRLAQVVDLLDRSEITNYDAKLLIELLLNKEEPWDVLNLVEEIKTPRIEYLPGRYCQRIDELLQGNPKKLRTILNGSSRSAVDFLIGPLLKMQPGKFQPRLLRKLVLDYIFNKYK